MHTIRLDLESLVQQGQITPEEATRLKGLALPDQKGSLFINLLLIFGALSVAAGTIALVPNPATGLVLAIAALGGAEALRRIDVDAALKVLGAGLTLMGALGLAGWIGWEFRESAESFYPTLAIAGVLGAAAIWYRSPFLVAPAVLALGATLGSGTGYWHASYGIFVEEPTLTILLFGALTAGFYAVRGKLSAAYEGLATIAARTSLFMVNFAFWVGSLWGEVFTLGWTAFLITMIVKARRGGFLSTLSVVFLSIHFYTQYFELLGANPGSLVVGGVILVGLAVGGTRLFRASRA